MVNRSHRFTLVLCSRHCNSSVHLKDTTSFAKNSVEKILGHRLDHYIPYNSYLVFARAHIVSALQSLSSVGWVMQVPKTQKVTPLASSLTGQFDLLALNAAPNATTVRLIVTALPTEEAISERVSRWSSIRSLPVSDLKLVASRKLPRYSMSVRRSDVHSTMRTLAAHPDVAYVEIKRVFKPQNYYSHAVMQGGTSADHTPFFNAGIDGSGQIVGVGDTGVDVDSCYFWDNAVNPPFK